VLQHIPVTSSPKSLESCISQFPAEEISKKNPRIAGGLRALCKTNDEIRTERGAWGFGCARPRSRLEAFAYGTQGKIGSPSIVLFLLTDDQS
jgi:hypothetical protein